MSGEPVVCKKCGKHRATIRWVGEGGALALAHGGWVPWCKCCVLQEQVSYARKQAAKVPELEKELAEVACESVVPSVGRNQ